MSNPEPPASPNPPDQPNQPNQEPSPWPAYGSPPSQPLPQQPQQPQWQQPPTYPQYGPAYPSQPLPQQLPYGQPTYPSRPMMAPGPALTRDPLPMILIASVVAIVLVGASILGTLAVSSALAGRGTSALNGAQISATSTAIAGNVQATATANAIHTLPTNPLAGSTVLTSLMCSSAGAGCQAYTLPKFTTTGPFVILWDCSTDYTSPGGSLQIVLSNGSGRQIDGLSEPCTGRAENDGIVSEARSAGVYDITVQQTNGPSWYLAVLEGAPTA